jgi:hypothetical protein
MGPGNFDFFRKNLPYHVVGALDGSWLAKMLLRAGTKIFMFAPEWRFDFYVA